MQVYCITFLSNSHDNGSACHIQLLSKIITFKAMGKLVIVYSRQVSDSWQGARCRQLLSQCHKLIGQDCHIPFLSKCHRLVTMDKTAISHSCPNHRLVTLGKSAISHSCPNHRLVTLGKTAVSHSCQNVTDSWLWASLQYPGPRSIDEGPKILPCQICHCLENFSESPWFM